MPEFVAAERAVAERTEGLLGAGGTRTIDSLHRELGTLMWNHCGMTDNDAGLRVALARLPTLRDAF